MANFVTNRIKLFGNKHIDDLVAEIQKRIRADINKTNEREDLSLVERIFYGRDHSDIKWSYENIGSKWIYPSMDGVDDELVFVTGGEPALGFQDHILKCASKVDPKVIVRLQYDDEMPNFVGARYVLIDKSKVVEFHNQFDTAEYTVVMEDEIESTKEELRDQGEDDSKVIWWEDLWGLLNQQKNKSLNEMKAAYKYTRNILD